MIAKPSVMRLILPYRASRKSSGDYQGICVRKGIISVAVLLILIMDQRRNFPAFMRVLKHGEAKCRWAIAMHTSIKNRVAITPYPAYGVDMCPFPSPVSTAPPGNKTQLSSWKAIIPTIAPTVPRIVSIIVQVFSVCASVAPVNLPNSQKPASLT